jgi:hypothetical protein
MLCNFLGIIPAVNAHMDTSFHWIDLGYLYAQHVVFYCFIVLPLRHVKHQPQQTQRQKSMDFNSLQQCSSSQRLEEFLEDDDNVMTFREFLLRTLFSSCISNASKNFLMRNVPGGTDVQVVTCSESHI